MRRPVRGRNPCYAGRVTDLTPGKVMRITRVFGLRVRGVDSPGPREEAKGSAMSERPAPPPLQRLGRPPLPRAPDAVPPFAYVLDADEDLAEEFEPRARFAAREVATARLIHVEPGDCDLAPWLAAVGHGPGLLILEGLIAIETHLAGRTVSELAGAVAEPDGAAQRGVRGPGAALAADLAGAAAPRRAAGGRPGRAAGDLLASAAGGPPVPAAVASGRTLGAGRALGAAAGAAAHPPAARPAGGRRTTVDLPRPAAAR